MLDLHNTKCVHVEFTGKGSIPPPLKTHNMPDRNVNTHDISNAVSSLLTACHMSKSTF